MTRTCTLHIYKWHACPGSYTGYFEYVFASVYIYIYIYIHVSMYAYCPLPIIAYCLLPVASVGSAGAELAESERCRPTKGRAVRVWVYETWSRDVVVFTMVFF